MYSLATNTLTYTFPLDHIDLKTICTRLERNVVDGKPLWNCPRNDQEYYSFELIARNTGCGDLESCNASGYPTVTCHICNIEVPTNYIIEHNNSEKHNICLNIADTALQRVKDQMFIDVDPSLAETVCGYYCEPCSTIVTEEDHNTTEIHKLSILHDKLLKDLLMIYSDKNNINKIDIKLPDSQTKHVDDLKFSTDDKNNNLKSEDDKNNNLKSQINNIRKKRTRTRNRVKKGIIQDNIVDAVTVNPTSVVIADNNCNIDADNDVLDDDTKSIKNYLKTITEIFPKTPMSYKYINKDFIQININGHKKSLYVDNFLGINRDSNKCLMCSNPVIEVSLEDHIYDFHHMKNVMAPVTDEHCLRQRNPDTYYCILCACKITGDSNMMNSIYYLITKHITSKIHTVNDRGALISNDDEKTTPVNEDAESDDGIEIADDKSNKESINTVISAGKDDKTEYYRALVANLAGLVYKDVDEEDEHYKGRIGGFGTTGTRICDWMKSTAYDIDEISHTITDDEMSQPDTDISQSVYTRTDDSSLTEITSNASIMEDFNHQLRATSNPKEISCKVCDVIVPNMPVNIKGHTTGSKHKKKYTEILTVNGIKCINGKKFCNLCKVQVPNKNELEHIGGRNHQSELLADEQKKSANVVPNVKKDEHNHNKAVVPVMEQNITYCNVCAMNIYTHNLESHINGTKHKQMAAADGKISSAVQTIVNAGTIISQKKTYCNVCAVYIDTHNFDNHINGGKHKQMAAANTKMSNVVKTFAQSTQSKLVDVGTETHNEKITYCDVCAAHIYTHEWDNHINGGKHKELAAASTKMSNVVKSFAQATHSELIAAPTETNNSAINAETKNRETNTNALQENFLYQMKTTDNIKSLFCRICNVNVPNMLKDVKIHVMGFNHQCNYSELLVSNKIRKDGERYICDACKVTITRRNEIDHVLGKNHGSNIKKYREQTD